MLFLKKTKHKNMKCKVQKAQVNITRKGKNDFSMFLLFSVAARKYVPILADEIYGDMVSPGQDSSLW